MRTFTTIAAATLVAGISFMAGTRWIRPHGAPAGQQQKAAAVEYACPMHPQYRSDHAGDCPLCGMRLEPVAAGAAGKAAWPSEASPPPGTVEISAERQQVIGVRLGVAERVSGTRTLRTTGRVAAKEDATYPLVSGVEARVREVRSPTAGTLVRKNELLASLYAPELLLTAQGYLVALNAFEGLTTQDPNQIAAAKRTLQRAEESLRNLGVSEGQIEELHTKKQSSPSISIASPVDGFVLQRNILVGQRVERGTELYRIADLRRVWILADVYENQLPFIHSGMKAGITTAQQNRHEATVSSAEPIFDEASQTMKVRLETGNPGFALKPGMFVDVEFAIDLRATLAVPADAIVDTGLRKTLFVDRGRGFFEPRQVETGWRIGGQVEIVKGLMPGERIVISSTFLIDSESRMKASVQGSRVASVAAAAAAATVVDPVCGMTIAVSAVSGKVERDGQTHYFCSEDCKRKFLADPVRYAKARGN